MLILSLLRVQISQISDRSSNNRHSEVLSSLCEGNPEHAAEDTPMTATTTTPTTSVPTQFTANSQVTPPAMSPLDHQSLGVTLSEADILLDRYKRLMAHSMPFVLIPSHSTAQQMYAERPFLLHAIVTVAYFHDLPKQQILVKHMMRDVSERMLMNNEKSLDILQGILVFIGWYHPHIFHSQQANNLLHLAMSMCIDMGIDRPPQQCGDFKSSTVKAVHGPNVNMKLATLDEHRALAGTYYLTSMLSSSFKKIEAMTYSKYLDDALSILERANEHESDLFLVQMVRLQHLIDDTCRTETPQAPMQMYVKTFKVDLERLRANDPCKDTNNVSLRLQYLIAEIIVWELSLNDLQDNKATPLRSHLDHLYYCVKAIRTFIDVYFTIPTSAYLTIPFSTFGQFAHAFITLVKLASLEVDGWDMKDLHEQLHFSKVIDEAADRYDGSTKSSPDGLRVNNDGFGKWAHRMRWMKQVYESKFIPEGDKPDDRQEATRNMMTKPPDAYDASIAPSAQQQPTPPDDLLSGDFFNYLDENFWQSFAGDFDIGFPEMAIG